MTQAVTETVRNKKSGPERRVAVDQAEHLNEVTLRGRLSQAPEEKVLPSGDTVWTFRLVVSRGRHPGKSRQTVDTIECAVWTGRARRSVGTWAADDIVEVAGALRRRFFRSGGAAASRFEVEVKTGKLIRRAGSA
jgi:single-strand DNA-binding protein